MVFLYSSDRNYANLSMISIVSLLENNQDADSIKIYYINNNIGKDNENQLNAIINRFKREIHYIDAASIDTSFITKSWYSISGYYRVLVTERIPEDRIIYLDCDTIVTGSFQSLWNTSLDGYLFGAVKDTVQNYVATSIGQSNNSYYINGGFLYINLQQCRECSFDKKVREYFGKFDGKIPHHDQGVINALGFNRMLYLSPRYNFQSQFFIYTPKQLSSLLSIADFYTDEEMNEAKNNLVVIHYLNYFYGRPWQLGCKHPLLDKFDAYASKYAIAIEKTNRPFSMALSIRSFIQKHLPFKVHKFVEQVLDKKREKAFWKTYKNIYEKENFNNQ